VSESSGCAVLDVGKTRVRVCVVDAKGRALGLRSVRTPFRAGPPYPALDAPAIFEWACRELRELGRAHAIEAIVPVGHGAAAALLAGDQLALPVLDYEFEGPAEIAGEYPAPPFRETRSPRLPAGQNLGRQLFWQARRFPEAWSRVTEVLPYPQYFAYRLSSVKTSELSSLGCHTDLWNPEARAFSSLVARCGWEGRFPPLRPAWETLGPLRPEIARATGLGRSCRVVCGIHDSNASYLAHRAGRAGEFTVVSTGTWFVALAAGAPIDALRERDDSLANVDAFGNPVACGRFMGGREYQALAGEAGLALEPSPRALALLVEQRTLALPSFAGQGGAFRAREGRVLGPPPRDAEQRAALGTLYCALVLDELLGRIGARAPFVIEGRFAKSPAFCGVLAALRAGAPVLASRDETGTLGGALWLAGSALRPPLEPELEPCVPLELAGLAPYRQEWRALAGAPARRD
jgi:sugar (pentulose or hexulose) kinase